MATVKIRIKMQNLSVMAVSLQLTRACEDKTTSARAGSKAARSQRSEAWATSSVRLQRGDCATRCYQHYRGPEVQHLRRVAPPVCCSDQAVTQRWRRAASLNESYRRTTRHLPSC